VPRAESQQQDRPSRPPGLPEWLEPELATLTQDRFSDPAWIFERKLDGERILAYVGGGDVRLMTRNQHVVSTTFPEITAALAAQGTVKSWAGSTGCASITSASQCRPRPTCSRACRRRRRACIDGPTSGTL